MDEIRQLLDIFAHGKSTWTARHPLLPLSSQVSEARYCHLETRLAAWNETRVALAGREYAIELRDGAGNVSLLRTRVRGRGHRGTFADGEFYPLHAGVIFVLRSDESAQDCQPLDLPDDEVFR